MKQAHFLFIFLFGLLTFSSCKKDDDSEDSITGTYNLTSITTNSGIDPEGDGTYGDTELIDNISCSSFLILNEDGTFTFDRLRITQGGSGSSSNTPYWDLSPLECDKFTDSGTFQNNETSVTLEFTSDPSLDNIILVKNDLAITYKKSEYFNLDPTNESTEGEQVLLTFSYTK